MFLVVFRFFADFFRLLPKRFFPDPRRLFAVADFYNTAFNTLEELLLVGGKNSREINKAEKPN